jgi:uncharacterized protein YbcC (UPF0753/DUF2309 family)
MNHNKKMGFDEDHVLHEIKHYLPSQTPIRDFIHHNSLHAFQHEKFYEAIFKASKIFGYQVTLELSDFRNLFLQGRINSAILDRVISEKKGVENLDYWKKMLLSKFLDEHNNFRIGRLRELWKEKYHFDLDNQVHPLLFRILASYLDQGISSNHFPFVDEGLLASIRKLESGSFASFFKTARARKLVMNPAVSMTQLLELLVGKSEFFEEYLFDQQFSHHGWSGMIATVEEFPHTLLYAKNITFKDLIILELLLEIDQLDFAFGSNWKPLLVGSSLDVTDLFRPIESTELNEVLKLWQDAFEWSYYDQVLAGIQQNFATPQSVITEKSFQAIFCIDERECSLRRHVEFVDPNAETLGSPGFFGVEFYFQPEGGKFYEKLCPAPVTPKYLIKEVNNTDTHEKELLHSQKSNTFFYGIFYSLFLGFYAFLKLGLTIFRPKMNPAISNAFAHMGKEADLQIENQGLDQIENGLQLGFTIQEMANRVMGLLKGIGMVSNFSDIVYVVAHGSSSANNPHHGAHDCGACSGRPGVVNARVFAFMVNHPKVRVILETNGIIIPVTTQFVGALHDTASDLMDYYDVSILNEANAAAHVKNLLKFEKALDLNAKERSRRFSSIKTQNDIHVIRKEIQKRSVSLFEPRPELGHGTNALCLVGTRKISKGLFLDRRAFMNSYDYKTDLQGDALLGVLKPIPPVCGGINLEYYFSRVDNQKFGAGTKLPHNVLGLIGVTNSSDGDLRPGLPLQMIEVHDPIRLMVIVEHFPEIILKTIQILPELYEWFKNEWVHLVSVNPETKQFSYFKNGEFVIYETISNHVPIISDLHDFLENAKEMETNHILDATKENLPIHQLIHSK